MFTVLPRLKMSLVLNGSSCDHLMKVSWVLGGKEADILSELGLPSFFPGFLVAVRILRVSGVSALILAASGGFEFLCGSFALHLASPPPTFALLGGIGISHSLITKKARSTAFGVIQLFDERICSGDSCGHGWYNLFLLYLHRLDASAFTLHLLALHQARTQNLVFGMHHNRPTISHRGEWVFAILEKFSINPSGVILANERIYDWCLELSSGGLRASSSCLVELDFNMSSMKINSDFVPTNFGLADRGVH
ncbi:hypothetical protein Tco_0450137 [Tanacetum coccineum]